MTDVKTERTAQLLAREYLNSRSAEGYSDACSIGVLEIALGIVNGDERFKGGVFNLTPPFTFEIS